MSWWDLRRSRAISWRTRPPSSESKGLDFIAANDISAQDAGFAVETNRVTLLFADGRSESLPLMSKTEVAETIIARLAALLE